MRSTRSMPVIACLALASLGSFARADIGIARYCVFEGNTSTGRQLSHDAMQSRDEILAEIRDLTAEVPQIKARLTALSGGFSGNFTMIELEDGDGTATKRPAPPGLAAAR